MTGHVKPLFIQLEKSRKRVRTGDVFVAKIQSGYIHGRVVSTTAQPDSFSEPSFPLIYIYNGISETEAFPRPSFSPPTLLIPPAITNEQGWRNGYFKTVGNLEITPDQLISRHAFRDPATGAILNEHGNVVPTPDDPDTVGIHALRSYLTIEDSVSRALDLGPTITYE